MSHTVKIFKLVNNEIIIGIIEDKEFETLETDEDDELSFSSFCFNIHFPFKLNSNYNSSEGTHEIYLEDWLPYSRHTFASVIKDKVLMMTEPGQDVFKLYETRQAQLETLAMETQENLNPKVTKRKRKTLEKQKFTEILKSIDFNDDDIQ